MGRSEAPGTPPQLLTTILDAVYIDTKGHKSIVSVKAKPAFQAILRSAGIMTEEVGLITVNSLPSVVQRVSVRN